MVAAVADSRFNSAVSHFRPQEFGHKKLKAMCWATALWPESRHSATAPTLRCDGHDVRLGPRGKLDQPFPTQTWLRGLTTFARKCSPASVLAVLDVAGALSAISAADCANNGGAGLWLAPPRRVAALKLRPGRAELEHGRVVAKADVVKRADLDPITRVGLQLS